MGEQISLLGLSRRAMRLGLFGIVALAAVMAIGAGKVGAQQVDDCANDRAAITAVEAVAPVGTVGFRCADGVVTTLYVSNYELRALPAEIGNFPSATYVYMDGNSFTSLPASIGNLTSVKYLYLDYNELTELPPEIGNLKKLLVLDVSSNGLEALPPEIGNLTSLIDLNLAGNKLAQVPATLGDLANLQTLSLVGNRLTTLPPRLGQLSNLTELRLFRNELAGLPEAILSLPALEKLDLASNQLTGLNPGVGNLVNLKTIDLSNNLLTAMPAGFGQLKKVEALSVVNNRLTQVDPAVWRLSTLKKLTLSGNQIGTISGDVGNLTSLTELLLNRNQLTAVPKEVGKLTNLRVLNLDSNQLKTVPAEVGGLANLTSLSLGHNQLEWLPVELGRISYAFTTDSSSLANGSGIKFPYVAIGECASGEPRVLVITRNGDPDRVEVDGVAYRLPANSFRPQSVTVRGKGPDFVVSVAGQTKVLRCQDASGESRDTTFEAEVSIARSCLAGNGRIDFNIVNSESDARYRIEFEGRNARERTVGQARAWRMPITGRSDGTYEVTVTKTLLADDTTRSFTRSIGVDCDQPVPVELSQEIDVIPYCVGDKGFVRYQFVNPTSANRSYVISFERLPNKRSTTARPYGAAVSGISARPNGTYETSIEYGDNRGTPVHRETVTIDCG